MRGCENKKVINYYFCTNEKHEIYLREKNKLALNSTNDNRKYENIIERNSWK